jgi:hypothetical protein
MTNRQAGTLQPLTIQEVASLTRLSVRTVIRIFQNEPGVIVLERPERPGKQRYRSFRIPRHVYERVMAALVRVKAKRRSKKRVGRKGSKGKSPA